MKYIATVGDQRYTIEIGKDGQVLVDGRPHQVDFRSIGETSLYSLLMDHHSYEVFVEEEKGTYRVLLRGRLYEVQVQDERAIRLAQATGGFAPPTGEVAIKAPMPGLVVAVPVVEGQEVKAGETVVILESMKMENELKAPRDGTVQRVRVEAGQSVDQHATLVVLV